MTRFRSVPRPGADISTVSLWVNAATPSGVPVAIMSPGNRAKRAVMCSIRVGISNKKSRELPD